MLARMWKKRNPNGLLVGMEIGTAPVENSLKAPQKIYNGNAMQSNSSE